MDRDNTTSLGCSTAWLSQGWKNFSLFPDKISCFNFCPETRDTNQTTAPQIIFLALFQAGCNIFFPPIIGDLPWSLWPSKTLEGGLLRASVLSVLLDAANLVPWTCLSWVLSSHPWLNPRSQLAILLLLEPLLLAKRPGRPSSGRLRKRRHWVLLPHLCLLSLNSPFSNRPTYSLLSFLLMYYYFYECRSTNSPLKSQLHLSFSVSDTIPTSPSHAFILCLCSLSQLLPPVNCIFTFELSQWFLAYPNWPAGVSLCSVTY